VNKWKKATSTALSAISFPKALLLLQRIWYFEPWKQLLSLNLREKVKHFSGKKKKKKERKKNDQKLSSE